MAAKRLDGMSDAELERLIGDYVREEALRRELLDDRPGRRFLGIVMAGLRATEWHTGGAYRLNIPG